VPRGDTPRPKQKPGGDASTAGLGFVPKRGFKRRNGRRVVYTVKYLNVSIAFATSRTRVGVSALVSKNSYDRGC